MRIVFVIPYFYDAWAYGGQPRSAYEMAKALVVRGHTVEVLTTDSGGTHRLKIPEKGLPGVIDGITVYYYPNISNALAFNQRIFLPFAFFRDVARRIRGADVVHIHELRSFLSVSAASACVRESVPFALSPHGGLRHLGRHGLKTVFDIAWGNRILRSAAMVIAISPIEVRDARAMDVPETRIAEVPNSVPLSTFQHLPDAGSFKRKQGFPEGRMLFFLGRLHPVKGADLLLDAFARMCQKTGDGETHLVIAGPDDGQGTQLRQMAERHRGRVTFTGYLDQTAKVQALVDSRLVVVPSRSEVFAITAVEALMCSRPVLLSSSCGLHPMPGEQHGVRTFKSESVEDLSLQLDRAINDQELFNAASRGRDFVMTEFSADVQAHRLETVYRRMTNANA